MSSVNLTVENTRWPRHQRWRFSHRQKWIVESRLRQRYDTILESEKKPAMDYITQSEPKKSSLNLGYKQLYGILTLTVSSSVKDTNPVAFDMLGWPKQKNVIHSYLRGIGIFVGTWFRGCKAVFLDVGFIRDEFVDMSVSRNSKNKNPMNIND